MVSLGDLAKYSVSPCPYHPPCLYSSPHALRRRPPSTHQLPTPVPHYSPAGRMAVVLLWSRFTSYAGKVREILRKDESRPGSPPCSPSSLLFGLVVHAALDEEGCPGRPRAAARRRRRAGRALGRPANVAETICANRPKGRSADPLQRPRPRHLLRFLLSNFPASRARADSSPRQRDRPRLRRTT